MIRFDPKIDFANDVVTAILRFIISLGSVVTKAILKAFGIRSDSILALLLTYLIIFGILFGSVVLLEAGLPT